MPNLDFLPDQDAISKLISELQANIERDLNFDGQTMRSVLRLAAYIKREHAILAQSKLTDANSGELSNSLDDLHSSLVQHNMLGSVPAYWLETRNVWRDDVKPALLEIIRKLDNESDSLNYQIGHSPEFSPSSSELEIGLCQHLQNAIVSAVNPLAAEKTRLSEESATYPAIVLGLIQKKLIAFSNAAAKLHEQLMQEKERRIQEIELDLAKVSPTPHVWNWIKFPNPAIERGTCFSSEPGVYLFASNRILYIGASDNVRFRLKTHLHLKSVEDGTLATPFYVAVTYTKNHDDAFSLERLLISSLRPVWNRVGVKRSNPDTPAAHTLLELPKAKSMFKGRIPTISETYIRDPEYIVWIAETITDKPIGEACRAFLKEVEEYV